MPAFSLHASYAKRIRCPFCGSAICDEIKPKARKLIPPRIRKVAVIGFIDRKMAPVKVLRSLNEALVAGQRPSIIEHLARLKKAGILKDVELTSRADLI